MTTRPIEVGVDGRIAMLTFNRPHVLNAFDPVLDRRDERRDGRARRRTTRSGPSSCAGEGRAFSAGFDLKAGAATAGQRDRRNGARCWRPTSPSSCSSGTARSRRSPPCTATASAAPSSCRSPATSRWRREGTRFGAPEVKFGSGAVALLLPWIAGLEGGEGAPAHRRRPALGASARSSSGSSTTSWRTARSSTRRSRSRAAWRPRATSAVRLTKLAINRSFDAMGLRTALAQALELDIFIESSGGPERAEFDRIRREEGLQAALAWRGARR